MYEVASNTRRVNGVDVETWEREIIDANILSVEAGTNGYQGGDTGHGGRTYIRISDEGARISAQGFSRTGTATHLVSRFTYICICPTS